jgi:hypothetical protein
MTKPRSFAPIIAAVLLLLPVLYVGSYLALVDPESEQGLERILDGRSANYRLGGRRIESFYWPLKQIDQSVRPKAWDDPWDQPVFRSPPPFTPAS